MSRRRDPSPLPLPVRQEKVGGRSALRRYGRYVAQRLAVLMALLILFYATSLHGISSRTFILVGILVAFLYWVFKGTV